MPPGRWRFNAFPCTSCQTPIRRANNAKGRGKLPRPLPLRLRSVLDVALVGLEDVVEIGANRERLALARKLLGRDVGEQLVPGRLVDRRLDVLGIDAGIPVEGLDDALGLDLGAGRERDEI